MNSRVRYPLVPGTRLEGMKSTHGHKELVLLSLEPRRLKGIMVEVYKTSHIEDMNVLNRIDCRNNFCLSEVNRPNGQRFRIKGTRFTGHF